MKINLKYLLACELYRVWSVHS